MTHSAWSDLHNSYKGQDWIDKPSLFATQAIEYFPAHGTILELGAGLGQDSHYFAESGYDVTATDIEQTAIDVDRRKASVGLKERVEFKQLDMRERFPFDDESYDIVYAHLSLHYFHHTTTQAIFDEIARVLRPGGVLAFLVNSKSDPEYNTGTQIEPDFYLIRQITKRFFDVDSVEEFLDNFEIELLDDKGETHKDNIKGVHNLIRFVGKRKI